MLTTLVDLDIGRSWICFLVNSLLKEDLGGRGVKHWLILGKVLDTVRDQTFGGRLSGVVSVHIREPQTENMDFLDFSVFASSNFLNKLSFSLCFE